MMSVAASVPRHLNFFIFFLSTVIGIFNVTVHSHSRCLHSQKALLLEMRSELIFNSSKKTYLVRWNNGTYDDDCCKWDGVVCDGAGRVIELHLLDEAISGGLNDSSTLFRLTHLQKLDLSGNHFAGKTLIPREIHRLTNLRELDLSDAGFGGPIPSTISNLTHLLALHLSLNYLTGPIPSFNNSRKLETIVLHDNNLVGSLTNSHFEALSNLANLRLDYNSLNGSIPHSLFALPSLELLFLSYNQFSGPINISNRSSNIVYLDLSQNSLHGSIPHSLFGLPSLKSIDLSHNQFSGQIDGPSFPINISNINLLFLELSHNSLSGSIPHDSLLALPSLLSLDLSHNHFSGKLNKFSANESQMIYLDLSGNQLEGLIPADSFFQTFLILETLILSDNFFNVLPSFSYNLSSGIGASLNELDLSNNLIAGDIPSWVWEISGSSLDLSCNLFENLQKPYETPTSLQSLDLHSNRLQGELPPLPNEAYYVDFSNNKFSNTIPPTLFSENLFFLSLANNSLSGPIPSSISQATQLQVLDLSLNKLSHDISPHLLASMENLLVLNLRGNNINGTIPNQVPVNCSLISLDLSNNKLGGKLPNSLANCKSLQVMDVGNNYLISSSFPCMLPSSSLRVLVLRSNRFSGEVRCEDQSWPSLQILDISSNDFSGTLHPALNFSNWRGMIRDAHVRPNRSDTVSIVVRELIKPLSSYFTPLHMILEGGVDYIINYQVEVSLIVKGIPANLAKIWPDFTSIDLSCNSFQGDIPDAIGNLTSLYLLNLSHNALTGTIPKSLGVLTDLGSLDLSVNQLRGRIPEELAGLTFLSVLNVSYNELVGMIPHGPQFQTFSADSFEGNLGLCGFPLNMSCSRDDGNGSTPDEVKDDEEIEWGYVSAALGYVVGFGTIVWILIFCRNFREIYFGKVEDVVENFFESRRRRVERRNIELRRR